ncbi:hypothetical protein LRS11_17985 [Pseudomonas sp. J452]|uniref:hypothetical protein n=1 Tax=Pseudomonas sp. J452 TaxID=2898441 RepID=UPI0021AD6DFB|nr:hypothetical protein [Pseudomonas sp. J452]UUY07690.1 hypothetical protein LRS11_17985 [Pseudomonas sp. J452]
MDLPESWRQVKIDNRVEGVGVPHAAFPPPPAMLTVKVAVNPESIAADPFNYAG